MSSLGNDLKVGIRQFAKNPGSTVLAILAYALGLGLVGLMLTLIFGVVKAHPKDIDFDKIHGITWDPTTRHLWKNGAQSPQLRYDDFNDLYQSQEVFANLAAQRDATFNIVVNKYAERYLGSYVTAEFFDVLGVSPLIGQFFEKGDDQPQTAKKAVLSYSLWQTQFGGKESIVGSSLNINGIPTTVIGVAREDFDFPSKNEVWVNETVDPLSIGRTEGEVYFVIGAFAEGQTHASVLAALNTIAKRLEQEYPDTNTGYIAFDSSPLNDVFLGDQFKTMMYLMLTCSIMVLLIACTNVANLTLSRATTRVRELAIRASLGGKRARLVLQMVIEGLAIAFFGGIAGLIIAIWTSKAIWKWVNEGDANTVPNFMNMDVDMRVIATLSIATLIASVVASIVPAMRASRTDVNDILKDNSRGSSGLRMGIFTKLLALFQLCISLGLLIATTALVGGAKKTAVFEPYYNPDNMMVARFDLPDSYYGGDQRAEGLIHLQNRLENNEALEGVGFTSALDMLYNWGSRWEVKGMEMVGEDDYTQGRHEIVSDNYFDLLGIPILYGRGFDAIDRGENAEQVCVINEVLAERLWPENPQNAIGQQFRDVWTDTNPWITVIGIVPDTKMAGPGARPAEQLGGVYRPMSAAPQGSLTIFAKSDGNPLTQARHIRSILHEENESIALYRIKTVATAVKESQFGPLFFRNIFGMFGIAALILASIGVYGVMDFSVRQRFQEFGIRQALGARRQTIMAHVFRIGGWQIILGVLFGSLLGWVLLTLMAENVGELIEQSISNYLIPVTVIVAISLLALFTPARYVTNSNLADCLRDE